MPKPTYTVELTWSEAANLLVAANNIDTKGWTPAARGALTRAVQKLVEALPMDDPNAFFLVVRGQTVVKGRSRSTKREQHSPPLTGNTDDRR